MAIGFPSYAAAEFAAAFSTADDVAGAIARDYGDLVDDAGSEFARMIEAFGRDLAAMSTAVQARYGIAPKVAAKVVQFYAGVATAQRETRQRREQGIVKSRWVASPRPDGHGHLNGKKFDADKGLKVDGAYLLPGVALGCLCSSEAMIPGLSSKDY